MPGTQSTNLTWTSPPFLADFEYVAASMKEKKPSENWKKLTSCEWILVRRVGAATDKSTGEVDTSCAGAGAVHPFWLWKAPQSSVRRHCWVRFDSPVSRARFLTSEGCSNASRMSKNAQAVAVAMRDASSCCVHGRAKSGIQCRFDILELYTKRQWILPAPGP